MAGSPYQFGKLSVWGMIRALTNNVLRGGGGVPVIFKFTATTLTGDVDIVMVSKVRVVDVWAVKTTGAGGAGDTVQVKNSSTAITNALDMNVADTTVVRVGTINDAQHTIEAGGTMRVTGASAVSAEVYVSAIISE